jgi:hypothetical protein
MHREPHRVRSEVQRSSASLLWRVATLGECNVQHRVERSLLSFRSRPDADIAYDRMRSLKPVEADVEATVPAGSAAALRSPTISTVACASDTASKHQPPFIIATS